MYFGKNAKNFLFSGKTIGEDSLVDLYVEYKGDIIFHHFIDEYEISKMLRTNWRIIDTFLRDDKFKEERVLNT